MSELDKKIVKILYKIDIRAISLRLSLICNLH